MFLVLFSLFRDRCFEFFVCGISLVSLFLFFFFIVIVELDYVEVVEFVCRLFVLNESLYFEVEDIVVVLEIEVYYIIDIFCNLLVKIGGDVKCVLFFKFFFY